MSNNYLAKKPIWPFNVNLNSSQSTGLLSWYPSAPANGSTLYDLIDDFHAIEIGEDLENKWAKEVERGGFSYQYNGKTYFCTEIDAKSKLTDGDFSLSLWIKINKTSECTKSILFQDNEYELKLKNNELNWTINSTHVNTSHIIHAGQWTHIALSSDNIETKTFVNGQLIHSEPKLNSDSNTPVGKLYFGFNPNNPSEHWDGFIEDVRIYNLALDKEAIQNLHDEQSRFDLFLKDSSESIASLENSDEEATELKALNDCTGYPCRPTLMASNSGQSSSSSTSHTITLPSGIQSGDLVVVLIAAEKNDGVTNPSGWMNWVQDYFSGSGPEGFFIAFSKIATGSMSTLGITCASSTHIAYVTYRFEGAKYVSNYDGYVSYTSAPDVGAPEQPYVPYGPLYQLVAVAHMDSYDGTASSTATISSYPSGYTTSQQNPGNSSIRMATALQFACASSNPGAWSLSQAQETAAYCFAIEPEPYCEPSSGQTYNETMSGGVRASGTPTTRKIITEPRAANNFQGLVGRWCPSINDSAKDASGNGNDGTYQNSLTTVVDTEAGGKRAYSLNGSGQYILLPASFNNSLNSTNITLSLWAKPTSLGTSYRPMITEAYTGDFSVRFTVGTFSAGNYSAGFNNNSGWYNAETTGTAGSWVHLTGTYDGSSLKLYVNGTLANSINTSTTMSGSEAWYIGRRWDYDEYFAGSLDDIQVYNRTLNATEINRLYKNGNGRGIVDQSGAMCSGTTNTSVVAGATVFNETTSGGVKASGTTIVRKILTEPKVTYGSLGLVGRWCPTLDNSANDISGKGNHGIYQNSTGTVVDTGAGGQRAYSLNGTDEYITIPATLNNFLNDTYITVSTWVKADQLKLNSPIITEAYNGDGTVRFMLGPYDANSWSTGIHYGTWNILNVGGSPGSWAHIVATYDRSATTLKLYVNGTLAGSMTSSLLMAGTENWYIGRRWDLPDHFDGLVDDVQIYNRTLTAGEVFKLYNNGSGRGSISQRGAVCGGSATATGVRRFFETGIGGLQVDKRGKNKLDLINGTVSVYSGSSTNQIIDYKTKTTHNFISTGTGADTQWSEYQGKTYITGKNRSTTSMLHFNRTSNYAIGCWAYLLDSTNLSDESFAISNGNTGANGSHILFRHSAPSYNTTHLIGGISYGPTAGSPTSTPSYFLIVEESSGNRSKIYQDGVLTGQESTAPYGPTATPFLAFGATTKTYLSEILFLDRVPTSEEIAWLANPSNSLATRNETSSTLTIVNKTGSGGARIGGTAINARVAPTILYGNGGCKVAGTAVRGVTKIETASKGAIIKSGKGTANATTDLQIWWAFSSNNGQLTLTDSTANGISGTLTNMTTGAWSYDAAVKKNVLTFDGVDDHIVTASNAASYFPTTSVTISVWFYPTNAGVIVAELGQNSANTGWHDSQIEILNTGQVWVRVWNLTAVSLGAASFNQWHHAIVRYNHITETLDGVLDNVVSSSSTTGVARAAPHNSGYGLYYALGSADSTHLGDGTSFDGKIGDFRVYSRALSNSEITTIYNYSENQQIATTSVIFNATSTGGVRAGSSAISQTRFSKSTSGGTRIGGTATQNIRNNRIALGGVRLGGIADEQSKWLITLTGGVRAGGTASKHTLVSRTSSGGARVGGTATKGQSSSIVGISGVRAGGLAVVSRIGFKNASGGVVVNGTASRNKLVYVLSSGGTRLGGSAIASRIGSKNVSGGVRLGGTALKTLITTRTALGGVRLGGTADEQSRLLISLTGGVRLGGTATKTLITNRVALGGVRLGGTAVKNQISNRSGVSGVTINGTATRNKLIYISSLGGVRLGGSAIAGRNGSKNISGGVRLGGIAARSLISNRSGISGVRLSGSAIISRIGGKIASGGVRLGGTAANNQTSNRSGISGVRLGGSAITSRIGSKNVSGGVRHGGTALKTLITNRSALGSVILGGTADEQSRLLIGFVGGVRLGGNLLRSVNISKSTSGGVVVSGIFLDQCVANRMGVAGAIIGGTLATGNSVTETSTGGSRINGIANEQYVGNFRNLSGVKVGGTQINRLTTNRTSVSGVRIGGLASKNSTYNKNASGGDRVSGRFVVTTAVRNIAVGGVRINGTSDDTFTDFITTLGGGRLGQSGQLRLIYSPNSIGGARTNGSAVLYKTVRFNFVGGVRCGGTTTLYKVAYIIGSNGVIINGTSNVKSLYDPKMKNGALINGVLIQNARYHPSRVRRECNLAGAIVNDGRLA